MVRLARPQGLGSGSVHPWSRDPTRSAYCVARAFPVDLALGVTEYLEVLTSSGHFRNTSMVWHRALNCGFKITATAGEDSILSLHMTPVMGADRTYSYLGSKLDYAAWVEAFRVGRTFVTNGPLVDLRINGQMPGDEIQLPAGGGTIQIRGRVQTVVPVEKLEVHNNGKVIESVDASVGRIEKTLQVT